MYGYKTPPTYTQTICLCKVLFLVTLFYFLYYFEIDILCELVKPFSNLYSNSETILSL